MIERRKEKRPEPPPGELTYEEAKARASHAVHCIAKAMDELCAEISNLASGNGSEDGKKSGNSERAA